MLGHRLIVSIAAGAILGVFCIIGSSIRSGFEHEAFYLFAFWYNRLLMGLVIGLAGDKLGMPRLLLRGALLGAIVSFAFYSSTGFGDFIGFLAGVAYGVIIEYIAFRFRQVKKD